MKHYGEYEDTVENFTSSAELHDEEALRNTNKVYIYDGSHARSNLNALRRRIPRSAAILVVAEAREFSYSDLVRCVRKEIDSKGIDITPIRTRRSIGGGIVFELPGKNIADRAEILLNELRAYLDGQQDIRISKVIKKVELNLYGFTEKFSTEEISNIMARDFDYEADLINCGPIKYDRNGVGSIRVKCPVALAVRLMEANKIKIGWSLVKAQLVNNRNSLRCYKCWVSGHVSYSCPEKINRRGNCFRCGAPDHTIKDCNKPVNCPIRASENIRSDHRAGGPRCRLIPLENRYCKPTFVFPWTKNSFCPDCMRLASLLSSLLADTGRLVIV